MRFSLLLSTIITTVLPCLADDPQPPQPSKPDGMIGGHEYVDLGLPSGTLWATCNIGATSPHEIGSYFAWGETEPREDFSWESYKFFLGVETDPENGQWAILENIGTNICGTEYDAARHQWGNLWRLPNEKERYELRMLCWSKNTTENGVSGVRIYGPNQHSIFLPGGGSGLWYGEKDPFDKTDSYYWTGEEEPAYGYNGRPIEPSNVAKSLLVQYNTDLQAGSSLKAYGICIRPVINRKESGIEDIFNDKDSPTFIFSNGYLLIKGDDGDYRVTVHDLSGRCIGNFTIDNGLCHVPALTPGIYMVTATSISGLSETQKIIIR